MESKDQIEKADDPIALAWQASQRKGRESECLGMLMPLEDDGDQNSVNLISLNIKAHYVYNKYRTLASL